jgi:AcrR family transcriptional regulator
MVLAVHDAIEPRKAPVQARSRVTVAAIAEATIQVLLRQGPERLTTTRVAERAGVSVGTLYQYFPNKQSLLFAVLEAHLDRLTTTVEAACRDARGRRLADMVRAVVEAFVDAKMARAEVAVALYRVASDVGGPALVKRMNARARKALEAMLRTAPDARRQPEPFAVQMMVAAMAGATRSVLEAGATRPLIRQVREHLVLLCQSYMAALAGPARR